MSTRRRQERMRAIRRRVLMGVGIVVLGVLAMTPELRTYLVDMVMRGIQNVQVFSTEQSAQMTLEGRQIYALQLGAYDNGERAQSEMLRLQEEGVLCVIWQREQMRLLCDAAMGKTALSADAAQGQDAWVIADTWPQVTLNLKTDAADMADVQALLEMPDALFAALCKEEESVSAVAQRARPAAQAAMTAYPDNALYTQLAQSLVNWCTLMDNTVQTFGESAAQPYARVTMSTLCYELRQALLTYADQSAASTASAQRTPSTAADVMPPA